MYSRAYIRGKLNTQTGWQTDTESERGRQKMDKGCQGNEKNKSDIKRETRWIMMQEKRRITEIHFFCIYLTWQRIRGHFSLLLHFECWLHCETTEIQRGSEPACLTVGFYDGVRVAVQGASKQVSVQQSQEEGMWEEISLFITSSNVSNLISISFILIFWVCVDVLHKVHVLQMEIYEVQGGGRSMWGGGIDRGLKSGREGVEKRKRAISLVYVYGYSLRQCAITLPSPSSNLSTDNTKQSLHVPQHWLGFM